MPKTTLSDPATICGKIKIFESARRAIPQRDIYSAVNRHFSCDWGNVDDDEWRRNDEAFKTGGIVVSRYLSVNGTPFLVITDSDRSATTVAGTARNEMKRAC